MRFLGFVFLILFTAMAAISVGIAPARATVSTTTSSVTAQGNGVTVSFGYAFNMVNAAYAVVVVTNTTVTPNIVTTLTSTQYTITGVGNVNGGTVVYPLSGSPLAAGYYITISRVVPLVQTTSLCNQGPPFCAVERALDYLTYIAQQLQTQIAAIIAGTVTPAVAVSSITRVTSGATTTALSTTTDQTIVWASATTSKKTTTFYGCTSAFSGYKIALSDEQGTASLYPLVVTPSSGTISGFSSISAVPTNLASASFRCDGVSNWVAAD